MGTPIQQCTLLPLSAIRRVSRGCSWEPKRDQMSHSVHTHCAPVIGEGLGGGGSLTSGLVLVFWCWCGCQGWRRFFKGKAH